jgi:hypothetical protein
MLSWVKTPREGLMSRRSRRAKLDLEDLVIIGGITAVLVAAAHEAGWLLATVLIAAGSYVAGSARRPRSRPAAGTRQSSPARRGGRQRAVAGPPARRLPAGAAGPVSLIAVSPLCTRDEHEWCEVAGCQCRCGHPGIRARRVPLPAELDDPPF